MFSKLMLNLKILKNKFIFWITNLFTNLQFGRTADYVPNFGRELTPVEQQQREQAVLLVKSRIKKEAASCNMTVEQYLTHNPDLLNHANKEDNIGAILRSGMDFSSVDIKTEEDKIRMIDRRIEHYKDLQKFKEERALIAKIRKARGDEQKMLYQEWRSKFGRKQVSN